MHPAGLKKLAALLLSLPIFLGACATPVKSEPAMPAYDGTPLTAVQSGYTVRLEDANGNALPTYGWRGGAFVEGLAGQAYAVRVDNPTGQRVEVVVTVDGRDVISGDNGDFRSQRGYIVAPYGSVRVTGFRQSMSDVAQFRFTTPGDSYSARRGTPQNVGVIGVAVFAELPPPPPPPPVAYEQAAPAAPRGGYDDEAGSGRAAEKSSAPSNLGTQYGERRYAPVSEVSFQRARPSDPDAVLAVYYDDHAGLVRRGVVPPDAYAVPGPQPFPESRRFAPPPP
jgi:hypothetical protein